MHTKIFNARLMRRTLYLLGLLALASAFTVSAKEYTLLNVSYDVSRELYKDINAAFSEYWLKQTGDQVTIQQSHDGSSKQAAAVIAGLEDDSTISEVIQPGISQVRPQHSVALDNQQPLCAGSDHRGRLRLLAGQGNVEAQDVDVGRLARNIGIEDRGGQLMRRL